MKALLLRLLEQVRDSQPATKAVLGAALALFVLVAGVVGTRASRPSFVLLYSQLDANQSAAVQSALAGGDVRYRVSQPPGPFVIHVDEGRLYEAQNLVALSGALQSAPVGIDAHADGAAQVFLSASERRQGALKRNWQEMERQLEQLEFVQRATVASSAPDDSPLLRRREKPTVAVTLQLAGGAELTREQAATVAKLVRFRFDVPRENVVVSDQAGRSLFDGTAEAEGSGGTDLLEHRLRYERDLVERTNRLLDRILGPGKAYVLVHSDWELEESETVRQTLDPQNKVTVSESSSKTRTPAGSAAAVGGAAGVASNLASEFGSTHAAVPQPAEPAPAPAGEPLEASTSETSKVTIAGRETELSRRSSPLLERLSVSLFVDESLADGLASLERSVKASVGFVETRGDVFSSLVTPFAGLARDENGVPLPPAPAPPVEEPSPWLELLVERGVELAAALAFLFLLARSLRSAGRAARPEPAPAPAAVDAEPEVDSETLARAHVEELLRSDPDKVGEILSRWALGEESLAGSHKA